MFERIVVGTDGSETAAEAVDQAARLAKATGGKLEVVCAYEPVSGSRLRGEAREMPGDVGHTVNPHEDVSLVLEAAIAKVSEHGVEASGHAVEGEPADALLNIAEEIGADLIVVGNKGMTGARRFLLGSVPNKVSHHATCGVLIARTTD